MRPVSHGDVVAVARVLLRLPVAQRSTVTRQLLEQASAADRFRKRLGRGHPVWGNGSLMATAMARPMMREPFLDDPDYCRCLAVVFEVLIAWRHERAAFNRPRRSHKLAQSGQVPAV